MIYKFLQYAGLMKIHPMVKGALMRKNSWESHDEAIEYFKNKKLFKKISEWPKCIEIACNKLEPHRIPIYLYELASLFHSYWNLGKDDPNKRFINEKNNISDEKLIFLKAISNVIKSGMDIVGVSTPEKM